MLPDSRETHHGIGLVEACCAFDYSVPILPLSRPGAMVNENVDYPLQKRLAWHEFVATFASAFAVASSAVALTSFDAGTPYPTFLDSQLRGHHPISGRIPYQTLVRHHRSFHSWPVMMIDVVDCEMLVAVVVVDDDATGSCCRVDAMEKSVRWMVPNLAVSY